MRPDSDISSHDRDQPPTYSGSCDLLFPTIIIDERVNGRPDKAAVPVMAEHVDTTSDELSSLSESTYEFVDTDTDSRDEDVAESIVSTDLTGHDEVASLDDSEDSEGESEDLRQEAFTTVTHDSANTSLDTPTVAQSMATTLEELEPTSLVAIEFEEPADLGAENVSVRHTIAELDEAQKGRTKKQFAELSKTTVRMTATIRQTMTKHCLSTKEPLRILYIGSHAGRQDIIHKIGSSVAASIHQSTATRPRNPPSSHLFNVIPVTDFGSDKTPEVELMHASGIQISVDDCVNANIVEYNNVSGKANVIKLILEDDIAYQSVPNDNKFIIVPDWDLPHIGIIYCTENDSVLERTTRSLANSFLARHRIPCIWITHKRVLEKPMSGMFLSPHAVHICLESRDPAASANIVHQRLPIDLASFLNIDARQMNRNIAYLTGLHEITQETEVAESDAAVDDTVMEKAVSKLGQSVRLLRYRARMEWQRVLPLVLVSVSTILAILVQKGFVFVPTDSLIINGNHTTEPLFISQCDALSTLTASGPVFSTTTSTKTATRTITVTQSHSNAPNSISLLPVTDLGRLNEKILPHTSDRKVAGTGKSLCLAEIISRRKILIRIPTTTLTSWLRKDAISLNVSRDDTSVRTKRVYSTSDGIVLQFRQRDAFGRMNISITTGRKPKINETLQVNFGSSWQYRIETVLEQTRGLLSCNMANLGNLVADLYTKQQESMTRFDGQMKEISKDLSLTTSPFRNRAQEYVNGVVSTMNTESTALVQRLELTTTALYAQFWAKLEMMDTKQRLEGTLLKAQVSSKHFWLRIRGKVDEYHDYKARAVAHSRKLEEEIDRAR